MGDGAAMAMNAVALGNVVASAFMSVSMNLLWGMVNTLQLIIHLPLISVYFPQNCQLFFSFIVDIVNFSLIPTDKIMNKIFSFKNSTSEAMGNNFKSLGYKSANILKNLGLIAVGLAALGIVVVLLVLVKYLANRSALVMKAYKFVSARIFFNSIIRAFLESYLKLCLSSFIAIQSLGVKDRE